MKGIIAIFVAVLFFIASGIVEAKDLHTDDSFSVWIEKKGRNYSLKKVQFMKGKWGWYSDGECSRNYYTVEVYVDGKRVGCFHELALSGVMCFDLFWPDGRITGGCEEKDVVAEITLPYFPGAIYKFFVQGKFVLEVKGLSPRPALFLLPLQVI